MCFSHVFLFLVVYTILEPGHIGCEIHLSQGTVLTESGSKFSLPVIETSRAF